MKKEENFENKTQLIGEKDKNIQQEEFKNERVG